MARSRKWTKDSCPFAKDQGYNSVIFDVKPGETVFGFTHTLDGTSDVISFATATARASQANRVIHQMVNTNYRVFATRANAESGASEGVATYEVTKTLTGFTFYGDNNETYDIIVVGEVLY